MSYKNHRSGGAWCRPVVHRRRLHVGGRVRAAPGRQGRRKSWSRSAV